MFTENTITYHVAFLAGLASFFTGCVLPLIPSYFSLITGLSLEELVESKKPNVKLKIIFSTLMFISGFSIVFIAMGASASLAGNLVYDYKDYIRIIGGIIVIFFGVHLTGIVRIRRLDYEKRIHIRKKPVHFLGALIIGMAFAAGWSPCIGPLLGSILGMAVTSEKVAEGTLLLSIYSAGLAIPFLIISVFINFVLVFIKKATHIIKYVNITAGVLLIIMGILLLLDKLSLFSMI